MKKQYFDNYISLGYNCQAAYSIEAIFGKNVSNMFNWAFVIDLRKMLEFLRNPDLLFSKGIAKSGNMYLDAALGFYYHSKNPMMVSLEGEALEKDKQEVFSRMSYLKDKFFNMVKSNDRNLFIMCFKSADLGGWDYSAALLDELYCLIEEMSGNKDFRMIVVFEKKYLKNLKIKKHKKLIIKSVDWFSYDRFAYDINWWAWYRIYRPYTFKFECKEADRFMNIKKYVAKYQLHPISIPFDIKFEELISRLKHPFYL